MSDASVADTEQRVAKTPIAANPRPAIATSRLIVTTIAGLLVMALGIVTLAGWILGRPHLLLVLASSSLPPIFYTTALTLALAGAAQVVLAGGSRLVAIGLALLVVALAASALFLPAPGLPAWLASWTSRIFVTSIADVTGVASVTGAPDVTRVAGAPGATGAPGAFGSMPASVAVGLLLFSGGLLIHAKKRPSRFCIKVARTLGAAAVLIGVASLFVALVGSSGSGGGAGGVVESQTGSSMLRDLVSGLSMSAPAAIALILLDVGHVVIPAHAAVTVAGPGGATCLPAIAGVACLLATLTLWQSARRQQDTQVARELDEAVSSAQAHAIAQFEMDRRQLTYIGRQIAIASAMTTTRPPISPGVWEQASRPYLSDQPGHRAALWIDDTLRIAAIASEGGDERRLAGVDLGIDLRAAAARQEAFVARADDLQRGRPTMLIAEPVQRGGRLIGLAAGLIDLQIMLRQILHDEERRRVSFQLSIASARSIERRRSRQASSRQASNRHPSRRRRSSRRLSNRLQRQRHRRRRCLGVTAISCSDRLTSDSR